MAQPPLTPSLTMDCQTRRWGGRMVEVFREQAGRRWSEDDKRRLVAETLPVALDQPACDVVFPDPTAYDLPI